MASIIQLSFVPVRDIHEAAEGLQGLRKCGFRPHHTQQDGFQVEARRLLQEDRL